MSNSPLIDCKVISPNRNSPRNHAIDRLTPHCVVGQLSAEAIGSCFASVSRQASCNYGIGYDGRVALICDEGDRSWCSSSPSNDHRAITIECASEKVHPYEMREVVYEKLILLCADICRRYGKKKVLWLGSKEAALAYQPKADEMVLTAHRWFAAKACPGDWLYSRYGELAERINQLLDSSAPAVGWTYTVRTGDSLWAIAARMLGSGSRYAEIKQLNGLKSDMIRPGQVLRLPKR